MPKIVPKFPILKETLAFLELVRLWQKRSKRGSEVDTLFNRTIVMH